MDNEKLFIEIPDELEVKREIQTIIKRNKLKRLKNRKKISLVGLAAAIFALVLLGFAFPGYASQIPFIGGIFAREDVHQNERFVAMSEDAFEIMQVQEYDGFTVTLSEVFVDGGRIYLAYYIESSGDALLATNNELIDKELGNGYVSFNNSLDLVVNGEPLNLGYSTWLDVSDDRQSKTMIFGIPAYKINEGDTVTARIVSIRGLETDEQPTANEQSPGNVLQWFFEFEVPKFAGIQSVDKVIRYSNLEVIANIIVSHSGVSINTYGPLVLEFLVQDDLGNVYRLIEMGDNHRSFPAPHVDATTLTIVPHHQDDLIFRIPEEPQNLRDAQSVLETSGNEFVELHALLLTEILISYAGEEVSFETVNSELIDAMIYHYPEQYDMLSFVISIENHFRISIWHGTWGGIWGQERILYYLADYTFPIIGIEPIIIELP